MFNFWQKKNTERIGNRTYLFNTTKYVCLTDTHALLEHYFKKKNDCMYVNIDGYDSSFGCFETYVKYV